MKSIRIVPISLAVLMSVACVSKQQHTELLAELTQCQEDKAQAEAKVITWEQRFDREASRWEAVGASINEQLPAAIGELHSERQRIIESLPEQVQGEVEGYLDEYFSTVMSGFDKLAYDNREIKMQLSATQKVLERVGADTQAISSSIDDTLEDERSQRQEELARREADREAVASGVGELVALVTKFDNTKINCKSCPDRLKLNRKQRETISAFHRELTVQLSRLQRFEGEPIPEGPSTEDEGG